MENEKVVYWDHFNEYYSNNIKRGYIEGKLLLPPLFVFLANNKDNIDLCDVGCACGVLYHVLKDRYSELEYCGFDLSKINIASAKRFAPGIDFEYLDITINDLKRSYGVIFSGEMLPHISLEHQLIVIKKLIDSARQYCIFSLKYTDLESFECDYDNGGHIALHSFLNYEWITNYIKDLISPTMSVKFHKIIKNNIKFLSAKKYIDKVGNLNVEIIKEVIKQNGR